MVTGSGFGGSRVPQNLGNGQSEEGHRTFLGVAPRRQNGGQDDSQTGRRATPIVSNDDLTASRVTRARSQAQLHCPQNA